MNTTPTYTAFDNWAQLLDHIKAGYRLYYWAPMDYRPIQVSVVVRKDGKVRVHAPYGDSDPFTVDEGHLTRFRRDAK